MQSTKRYTAIYSFTTTHYQEMHLDTATIEEAQHAAGQFEDLDVGFQLVMVFEGDTLPEPTETAELEIPEEWLAEPATL
ncbi:MULTISPECIES: hypothetical protein [Burkholderiaceae]|uniref:hypothetical protein n=1 Tax=Burkholderiaceae TaxID=119060 RepID=UPI00055765CA|nr:hypothetical protein [Burkholderia sp. 9120]